QEASQILGLLEKRQQEIGTGTTIEDQRAKAVILAAQPSREQQVEAIRVLEGVNERQRLSSEDIFLLAQLYERTGNSSKARDVMMRILASDPDNASYLAYHVLTLLRSGQAADAELWLAK